MGSVCQCVFRVCCSGRNNNNEESDDENSFDGSHNFDGVVAANHNGPPVQMRVDREFGDAGYTIRDEPPADFWRFLQGFLHGFGHQYHQVVPGLSDSEAPGLFWSSSSRRERAMIVNSPLRTASSFDASTSGTPAIEADEIVLPGSQLQLDMAKQMAAKLETQDDECVICMEGFDADNPRMPTLCGCGENRTYFHLPCLYQWVDRNRECPSCRQELTWEEF